MKSNLKLALAASLGLTLSAGASNAAIIDLGFLMDESGSVSGADYSASMNALATALANNIPVDDATFTYRVGVVSFGSVADTSVTTRTINSQADLDALVAEVQAEASDYANAGSTNYNAAFNALISSFGDISGSLNSIVNMTTDGNSNTGGDPTTGRDALIAAGWDALSFESVGGFANTTTLSGLAFDTNGIGGAPVFSDPNLIGNPLTDAFVLEVANFGTDYATAIDKKIQRTIDGQIPVPAALPLLATGFAFLGFVGRRRKKS